MYLCCPEWNEGYCDFLFGDGRNVDAWPFLHYCLSEVKEVVISSPDFEVANLITPRDQVCVELSSV